MLGIVGLLVLFALSILFPKSKPLAYVIMVFMIVAYGFNSYSGDYQNYENAYNSESISFMLSFRHFEPLYSFLMAVCKLCGLNFTGFRVVLALFYVITLYNGIKIYTKDTARVLGIYMIFPFTFFVSVLRAGLAGVVLLYSSRFLCVKGKENKKAFVLGVMIATMFHYSSIIFLFALISKRRFKKKTIVAIILASAILAYLYNYTNILGSILGMITSREKTLLWGTKTSAEAQLNMNGTIALLIILISGFFFTRSIYHKARIHYSGNALSILSYEKDQQIKTEIEFAYGLYYLSVLIFPFMIINPTWLRVVWQILVFIYIGFVNTADYYKRYNMIGFGRTTANMCLYHLWIVVLFLYIWGFPSMRALSEFLGLFGENNIIFGLLP